MAPRGSHGASGTSNSHQRNADVAAQCGDGFLPVASLAPPTLGFLGHLSKKVRRRVVRRQRTDEAVNEVLDSVNGLGGYHTPHVECAGELSQIDRAARQRLLSICADNEVLHCQNSKEALSELLGASASPYMPEETTYRSYGSGPISWGKDLTETLD